MISKTQFISSASGVALLLIGACAPDSSVGSDPSNAGSSAGPTAGASVVAGNAGSDSPASGGAPANGGSSNSGGSVASGGSSPSGGAQATAGAFAAGGAATAGAGPAGGAGPVGGAGPGGDSRCPGLIGATSCDGFENAAPGETGSDWTIDGKSAGTITVDTSKFYRGKKSVKYSSATRAYIVNKKIFAGTTKATNNEFWGRYFVLAGVATYPAGHTVFGSLADATDSSDPNRFHFVGGSRQQLMAEIRITTDAYTNAGQANPNASAPHFPITTDGWQCWEFHVTADDSFAFYINSTEVADMRITKGKADASGKSFSPLPTFGQIQLGWQSFSTGAAVSGWIDEVAFGPSRIGCSM